MSQDLETRDDLGALFWVEGTENGTFHDDTTGDVDITLSGDPASGENVIPGAHLDGDASMLTRGDGLLDTGTKGVFDSSDARRDHAVREIFIGNFIRRLKVGARRGPRTQSFLYGVRLSSCTRLVQRTSRYGR